MYVYLTTKSTKGQWDNGVRPHWCVVWSDPYGTVWGLTPMQHRSYSSHSLSYLSISAHAA